LTNYKKGGISEGGKTESKARANSARGRSLERIENLRSVKLRREIPRKPGKSFYSDSLAVSTGELSYSKDLLENPSCKETCRPGKTQ